MLGATAPLDRRSSSTSAPRWGRPEQAISSALRPFARAIAAIQLAAVAVLLGAILLVLVGVGPTFVGYETFTVLSGSMEPAIKVGDLAVVQPVPTSQLGVGDIITYRTPTQPDVLVTHRVLEVQRTEDGRYQFQTKGDANQVADLVLVEPGAVLGRVVYSVPYAGFIGDFAKRPTGVALFLGVPGLLLALDFLRERLRRPAAAREQPAPVAAAAPASNGTAAASADAAQAAELLRLGRQALEAGHRELAAQAADRVIQLDPRSEDGWILKADCAATAEERLATLRTAALVNPQAGRVARLLQGSSSPA